MWRIGPPKRRPSVWRMLLRAAIALPVALLLCLIIGAIVFFPFPIQLVPLPWAVGAMVALGALLVAGFYLYELRHR